MANPRILVLCQRGNVRSATAATVLRDFYMFDDVLCTGIETTTPETMKLLMEWANITLLAYGIYQYTGFSLPLNITYFRLDDVEDDVWGKHMHPELVRKVISSLEKLVFMRRLSTRWSKETYLQLIDAKYAEGHPIA